LATKLRKEFIKLLEKDPEFRQTVAGYLGLAETLKKLDQHLEELRSIRQEQQKIWQNIERLWQEVRELRQDQTKLWEEVRGLREDQERLWQEVRELRLNQTKLWENTEKLWEEVKALRENQEKLWEEVRELRHDFIVFRTELTGISATVGAIAESGARRALREWAAAQGIRLGRLRSITVEGRKGILYAEAKSTVRSREVEDFSQLASAAEKIYGQGLKVILGFKIYEEAYEAAGKEGITLVEA
jgi:predicted RNase H-like nuclease (RuvC/YqgF family)